MADYSTTFTPDLSVSIEDTMTKIRTFLLSDPGPAWTAADITFHPLTQDMDGDGTPDSGSKYQLFLKTSGATPYYLYIDSGSVSVTIGGLSYNIAAIRVWYCKPSVSAKFDANQAPLISDMYNGQGSYVLLPSNIDYSTLTYEFTNQMRLLANSDRLIIAVYSSNDSISLPPFRDGLFQLTYGGAYVPHCDAGSDVYPEIVAGNADWVLRLDTEAFGENVSMPETGSVPEDINSMQGIFPSVIIKGISDPSAPQALIRKVAGRVVQLLPDPNQLLPRNGRQSNGHLLYPISILINHHKSGEGATLIGVYAARSVGTLNGVVEVGADSYLAWPWDKGGLPDIPNCLFLGPMGTTIAV